MIHYRDVPVTMFFTKNVTYSEFLYDVGIGDTDFILVVNTQQNNTKTKVEVIYGNNVEGSVDFTAGLVYIVGSVTTTATGYDRYLQVKVTAQVPDTDTAWLGNVTVLLTCTNQNSPAPLPYRVKVNTTGTAIEQNQVDPSWLTTGATSTNFRDPTSTVPGYTTTAFDPTPVDPIFPSTLTTGLPTGQPNDGQPPATTSRPPSSGTTAPPTTQPVTSAAPVTMPVPATTTVAPTVTPTASPTQAAFEVTFYGLESTSTGSDFVAVTEANKNTLLQNTLIIANMPNMVENKLTGSKASINQVVRAECSGGSGQYRFVYTGLIPNLYPVRDKPGGAAVPAGGLTSNDIVAGDTYYDDNQTYQSDTVSRLLINDNRIKSFGFNSVSDTTIHIAVDDGYTTVERDIKLFFKTEPVVLSDVKTAVTNGNQLIVGIPQPYLVNKTIVFKFEATQNPASLHTMNGVTRVPFTVDFKTGKQHANFTEKAVKIRHSAYIDQGFTYSILDFGHITANLLRGSHDYRSYYGRYHEYRYYLNYSPIALGVLKVAVRDLTTKTDTVIHIMLMWCTTGPYAGWASDPTYPMSGKNPDYIYTPSNIA